MGTQNDGQYAELMNLGPYDLYGWITAAMNQPALGEVYVYGYGTGPNSPLYVYTSSDGINWNLLSVISVDQESPGWIDLGLCNSTFNYIEFSAQYGDGYHNIFLNTVAVYPLTNQTLNVSCSDGGFTNMTSGAYQYIQGTNVNVTAYPGSGYTFDCWLLDGVPCSSYPEINVTMDGCHSLQAVFQPSDTYHYLTIDAYGYDHSYYLVHGVSQRLR